MKVYTSYLLIFFIVTFGLLCFSCSENKDIPNLNPNPLETSHFDIWVTAGGSSNNTVLVKSFKSLDRENDNDSIDFKGSGVDITAKLYQEAIIKGQYYYQIPKEKDRFGKYRIGTNGIEIVREVAFGVNTYKDRRYTHVWTDDNTLVIIAANGNTDKVIWTKIDATTMTIMAEGTLDLERLSKYSTSGIASYRISDNKILYSYCHGTSSLRKQFYMAFINPSDMRVEKTVVEDRAEFMAGTAYGELLQSKCFFDTNGDYYLACNTVISNAPSTTQQFGTLLRIKKGETDFDKGYTGFIGSSGGKGKIVTIESLSTHKALLYVMDPEYTGAPGWGSEGANCYYAILDLNTDRLERLSLPHSKGNFSQRSIVLDNKAYIGVNPENSAPLIYIYNIQNGELGKGKSIKSGYSFDRIVRLAD